MTWRQGSTRGPSWGSQVRSDCARFSVGCLLCQNRRCRLLCGRRAARLDFADGFCLRGRFTFGQFLAVEVPNYTRHVGPRFKIGWHTAVLFHTMWAGIVSGKRFDQVEVVALQEFPQIARTAFDIGARIEGV